MQIVIEIPEEKYEWIKEHKGVTDFKTTEMLYNRVRKGAPLSEVLEDIRAEIEKELKISDELELIGESAAYRKSLEIINEHINRKESHEQTTEEST